MGLALGGYALLLSTRRGPTAGAPAPDVTSPVPPPVPQRLPRRPNFEPASAPAFAAVAPAESATLRVRVVGLPAAEATNGAGVFVRNGRTNAFLLWLPLAGAERTAEGLRLAATVPSAPLRVTVAPSEDEGAHGWWAARDVTAAELRDTEIELRAPLQDVAVSITAEDAPQGTPFSLARDGAPEWSAPEPATSRMPDERGLMWLRLAPGSYRLAPLPLPPGVEPFAFTVPGPGVVDAKF